MNDTALQTQDSGDLRPSSLSFSVTAPHNIESLRVSRGETVYFLKIWMTERGRNGDLRLSKEAAFFTAPEVSDPGSEERWGGAQGFGGLHSKIVLVNFSQFRGLF